MPNAVNPEVGLEGVVIVPEPPAKVHVPVPTVGVFPAKVAVVAHTVWSVPAFAVVGVALTFIITVSLDGVHVPLEIVQTNLFCPVPKAVNPEVGLLGVVIVPAPLAKVQVPVPTFGVFPAKVAVVAQIAWSVPAFAVVGLTAAALLARRR